MFPLQPRGKNKSLLWTILLILGLAFLILTVRLGFKSLTGKTTLEEKHETGFVERVIDGDTFVLDNGEHVRLVCINTPEKGEPYYQEAKDSLTRLVLNKEVLLEKDTRNKDKYGRLLRYIRSTEDNHLYNQDLIGQGLAKVYRIRPDEKYCDLFEEAQIKAQQEHRGLWS